MMTHRFEYTTLLLLALVITAGAGVAQEGRAWGDIHVETLDGAIYEFQQAGEFVASRSAAGDLEVQLRLESTGFPPHVSIATAVAVLVDTTRASVVLGREPMLFVDERPTTLPDGVLDLPGGGWIERSKRGYEIFWSDGSILSIDVRKRHLNAFLRPAETRRSTLTGLFGNFNGSAADDVEATIAAIGSETDSPLDPGLLTELARSLLGDDDDGWQLAQEESLFEYKPGQSTFTFRRPKTTREVTSAALPASRRRQAQEVCKEAGVTAPDLLEACIVDVGYTRDESFADTAAAVQARDGSDLDLLATRQPGN